MYILIHFFLEEPYCNEGLKCKFYIKKGCTKKIQGGSQEPTINIARTKLPPPVIQQGMG